ncbi:hypothetical protein Tco_1253539 [Tanacetum coccineum]
MDDPNITMEEYIRLEEEKAQRHGRTFNWQTATYGKMEYCEDEDDSFTNFETEYPAIVFDDTSDATLLCKPTVSPLNNNEIDFKISFDESNDEDYMVIFDENLFSYKIISVDNLKTDSEPMIGYIDCLEFFKDFENEFPAIAYNDDLKSKSDPLIESSVSSRHIDKFDSKNETSLAEYDEEEQNSIDTKGMSDTEIGLDVADTLCFHLGGARRKMTWRQFILALGLHNEEEMAEAGFIAYCQGSERVIPDKGDLRDYWIEISSDRDFLGPAPSYVFIRDPVRRLCHRMIACSISGRGQAPKKVTDVDLFYLRSIDRGTANVTYLLVKYLFRHVEGRKSGARLSGGHFIRRLAAHFGLVSDQGLRGLSMVTSELPLIDLHKLVRLNIARCLEVVEEESESDFDAEIRLSGSLVESSKQKPLKKFAYINEKGETFQMTKVEIKNQKGIEQVVKADVAKSEIKKAKQDLIDLLGWIWWKRCTRIRSIGMIVQKKSFKANDLHLGEWKEVMEACAIRTGAG